MKSISRRNKRQGRGGGKLVEMLAGLAVIAILAGISVMVMPEVSGEAKTTKSQRNAQTLCALYHSARSIGVAFSSNAKEGIAKEMMAGMERINGMGHHFKMSPLSQRETAAALDYCTFDVAAKLLLYEPEGAKETVVPGGAGRRFPTKWKERDGCWLGWLRTSTSNRATP
jgi:hypothetical protein